jgi:hypothetical protein
LLVVQDAYVTRARVEAVSGLGHAAVEQVRIALERDQRVGVTRDGLDELDVGAGSHATRHAGMPQIVKAVVLVRETSELEGRLPDPLPEVRRLQRSATHRTEDEFLGRISTRSTARDANSRKAVATDGKSGTERRPDSVLGRRSRRE